MGKKLLEFYDEAKKIGGLSAQIKLAILTRLPASQATIQPDSIENIALFRNSMEKVKTEFSKFNHEPIIRGN